MFKKEERLTAVRLKNPKSIKTSLFGLKYAKNNLEQNKYAVIVGKKIDKRAVTRNRLKRKYRKNIYKISDRIEKGYDFVFFPKLKAREAKAEEIGKDLKEALLKEKLIK